GVNLRYHARPDSWISREGCREMTVVGVTGHRFLADLDRVERGVQTALDRIEQVFGGRPLEALSALAEGADRIVAEAVLARPNGRLVAVLPLAADEYERDFASARSRRRFRELLGRANNVISLPKAPTRDAAYEAAGRYVADRCDALVAIWDGRSSQGRGGTAG